MRTGPRSISRSASVLASIALVSGDPRRLVRVRATAAPRASDRASGFPFGAFARRSSDPDLGRVRLVWVFEPDGRYAEIPFALDGQPQGADGPGHIHGGRRHPDDRDRLPAGFRDQQSPLARRRWPVLDRLRVLGISGGRRLVRHARPAPGSRTREW